MGVNVIPPSTGGAEVLPVGATSTVVEGYNADGFYIYGSTLPAGTYCVVIDSAQTNVLGEPTGYIIAHDNKINISKIGNEPAYVTLTTDETRFSCGGGLVLYTADQGAGQFSSSVNSNLDYLAFGANTLVTGAYSGTNGGWVQVSKTEGHSWNGINIGTSASFGGQPALAWTYGTSGFLVTESTATTGVFAKSTDGINWSTGLIGIGVFAVNNAKFVNDRYFVTSGSTAASGMRASTDLVTWTNVNNAIGGVAGRGIGYHAGLYLIGAASGSLIQTSTDGTTWTGRSIPLASCQDFVTYPGATYVIGLLGASNATNQAMRSTDGITWTAFSITQSAYGQNVGSIQFAQRNNVGMKNKYLLQSSGTLTTAPGGGEWPLFMSTDSITWFALPSEGGTIMSNTTTATNVIIPASENGYGTAYDSANDCLYHHLDGNNTARAIGVSNPSQIKFYNVNTASKI